jgi:hypothetical protein
MARAMAGFADVDALAVDPGRRTLRHADVTPRG